MEYTSTDIAKISVKMSISSREEEKELNKYYKEKGILTTAVDIGGNINTSIPKVIERALVAAKRSGIIKDCHLHDGAVAGATREALSYVTEKANGLNVGGKIGIARHKEHLSVCIFMSIGLLHLNEVVIGIGHRSIPEL
ncbi:HutP family protein [Hathewaya histolytica]|uniref:Hut operon positive regulatory protein n=1 Tax=Hathewaya histolytica TaxID=1498 RepID=A0A4U9R4G5_HATHI|nr:HutP family protein [Hathewaya histolytica]VTQ86175.1 L-lactate dehydrogenase (FMN-dependent) and related alpha-hydroxy acid dehydrogenases [Hathewaya histolytica]